MTSPLLSRSQKSRYSTERVYSSSQKVLWCWPTISRSEYPSVRRKLSFASSTFPSRSNSITAWARSTALTRAWASALASLAAVTSVANLTTFIGAPLASRTGLYVACSHTSRPPLVTRRYSPAEN